MRSATTEAALQIHRIDREAEVRLRMWKSLMWMVVAVCGFLSIRELAGKETLATLLINAVVNVPEHGVSWSWILVALAAGAWGGVERWIRLRKVAQMSARIKQLEKQHDPDRTSSGLTESGETPRIGGKNER